MPTPDPATLSRRRWDNLSPQERTAATAPAREAHRRNAAERRVARTAEQAEQARKAERVRLAERERQAERRERLGPTRPFADVRPLPHDAHREPAATAWLALVLAAPLPALPALPDTAEQLATLADTSGVIDPEPTLGDLAAVTSWSRPAIHRVLRVLAAAGWATTTGGVLRLTVPDRPPVKNAPDPDGYDLTED